MTHLKTASLLAALLSVGLPAHAAVYDGAGDFLASFTGTRQAALDVLSADVSFDAAAGTFTLLASTAGDITSASNVTYVFGFNTGTGTNAPFASIGAPNVKFDTTVQLRANGSGTVAGKPLAVDIKGHEIRATFDAALLPSKGLDAAKYEWALWSIDSSISGLARNADFAPTANISVSAVPEPQTYALMLAGLGAVGGIALRRRR